MVKARTSPIGSLVLCQCLHSCLSVYVQLVSPLVFPSHMSTMPESTKSGCVVGGLVVAYRFADTFDKLKYNVLRFFDRLKIRGFVCSTIRAGIAKFLRRHIRRHCRKENGEFLLSLIDDWPFKDDLPAREAVFDYLQNELNSSSFAEDHHWPLSILCRHLTWRFRRSSSFHVVQLLFLNGIHLLLVKKLSQILKNC